MGIQELVINLDNGPNSSGRRTQFLKRMTEFSDKYNIKVRLIYYPPYHSKYNAIERCWGRLEEHWNGEILNSINKAVEWAKSMTWNESSNPIPQQTPYTRGIFKKNMTVSSLHFSR